MNSAIKYFPLFFICLFSYEIKADAFPHILKNQIQTNGYIAPDILNKAANKELAAVGKKVFESNNISLTSDISCQTCHFEDAGSGDGIPVSAAIGGHGKGEERLMSGGKLLARNSLPLWGRGANHFGAFFWDGKVIVKNETIISQFGTRLPSNDPLVVALHLPVVEIREMLDETDFIRERKLENVDAAYEVYEELTKTLVKKEKKLSQELALIIGVDTKDLEYKHFALAIAEFIRKDFPIKETKLSKFIAGNYQPSDSELNGGLIFYGKGGCVNCHSGPHFSDFSFYAIPFPQSGFGKNGFGVDYGRYSATFNPDDIYKFRTPPLWNVERTGPYSHSGSASTLYEAITYHFNPLEETNVAKLDRFQKHELYKKMAYSQECVEKCGYLTEKEVKDVVNFLEMLTFN